MVENVSAEVTARDVVAHILRREARVITVREPHGHEGRDAKRVHQLRVSARRLRSELRWLRGSLPREPWRELDGELKWLGATLGHMRDLEVLTELFDAQTTDEPTVRGAVMSALQRRSERRRDDVRVVLDSPRYAALAEGLDHLARRPHLGATGKMAAGKLFLPPLWATACRYLDVVGDPRDRRDDEDLHHIRIASKKCRYSFEVATLFVGEPARVVAESLEAVQGILGDVHDREVAVAFLDTLKLPEETDLDLRRALRAQVIVLRPQWAAHFDAARHGFAEVFRGHEPLASPPPA
jgi:CHAD domain-containing protein